jgi:aspartate aminotransferase
MTQKARDMKAAGRDIISLSAGEPDFDTPDNIKEAAIAAINRGETKYTPVPGIPELRTAIVGKFERENNLAYSADQIIVGTGGKQVLYNALAATLNPGDEVIIPAPYWVSYPDIVNFAGGTPVIVEAGADQGYKITPAQLEAAISPKTKWLILNSPSNPTGAAYSAEELKALAAVILPHENVMVMTDDMYEHIWYADFPFATIAQVCPDLYDRTLTVNGVSKAYAMTGWRLGYAAGPKELIRGMAAIQSQSTTNACSISQAAAVAALNGDQTSVRNMCHEFKARHDILQPLLDGIEGLRCAPSDGAFYLFVDVREALVAKGLKDDIVFCEALLDETGVALVPGTAFGAPGYVRISFAASLETMNAAIARIKRYLGS